MKTWLRGVADDNWRAESKRGRFHFAFKLVLPFIVVFIGGVAIAALPGTIPQYCIYSAQYLPAPWLVAAGIGAFAGGRFFTRLRAPRPHELERRTDASRGSVFVGQLAWVALLMLLVGVWFYEAIGTAHVSAGAAGAGGFEPITYYIRCAIYDDRAHQTVAPYTLLVVSFICFLAGRWLWSDHKDVPPPPRSEQVTLS